MHRVESVYPQIAQLIQADLQAVGMKVSLQGFEQAAFGAKINAGEHQVAINDWTMGNSDPDNVMWGLFSTNRARVRMSYENPQVDKLNRDAQVDRDPTKRRQMYLQSQRLVLEDAPFVTLGYPDIAMGARANIDGLLVSPLSDVVMREVKIRGA